jgi:hypothetical protein
MKPRYDEIPEELRALPNWVVWNPEKRTNTNGVALTTKVPYNARSGCHAKSNDPRTWSRFDEAKAALKGGYAGLGFCLTTPYVGVDLDGCRSNGRDEPWAAEIISELASYTELSPSGRGVRVIAKGELPDGRRQKDMGGDHHGVGLYDAARGRYLTMTGNCISGNGIIADCTAELRRIHERLFSPTAKATPKAKDGSIPLHDEQLIERALNAKDGGKFSRLWNGEWESDYASQSEADLALAMKLAFWAGRDAGRIDALFRRSKLMRDKWNREDYRERTISAALERQTETVDDAWLHRRTVVLAADAAPASIDTLNAMPLFHGRLSFRSFSRRGSMVLAATAEDKEIIWPTTADLVSFGRARSCVAECADILLPQPPRNQIAKVWEPAVEIIVRLAAQNAVRVEHVLRAECRDLLILMWRYARQPHATNSEDFVRFLVTISESHRGQSAGVRSRKDGSIDPPPAPPAVFIAEGFCWVHVPTWRNWLSLPSLTNRLYPLADIRQGLMLLGFEYHKDVTRGHEGESVTASLWRGRVDVLAE